MREEKGERREQGPWGLRSVYFQDFRTQGGLRYTGKDLLPEAYTSAVYPGVSSISYEYITYNEAFSSRDIVFSIPMSALKWAGE